MKFLRILGGVLLICAGAFCGMYAYAKAGGMHGWNEFRPERLLQGKDAIFAIGCPFILLVGVGAANSGSRLNFVLAVPLAFGAAAVAMPMAACRDIHEAVPWMAGGAGLAFASAIMSAAGRKAG